MNTAHATLAKGGPTTGSAKKKRTAAPVPAYHVLQHPKHGEPLRWAGGSHVRGVFHRMYRSTECSQFPEFPPTPPPLPALAEPEVVPIWFSKAEPVGQAADVLCVPDEVVTQANDPSL